MVYTSLLAHTRAYPRANSFARPRYRYLYPYLENAQNLSEETADGPTSHGLKYTAYRAKGSVDKSLTAFAQLITLRLGVKRAMVSLIDSSRQYILAEATRSLSLNSESTDAGDEMWLGHAIITRRDALCHNTFGSEYSALEENGESYVTDALVIPDCRYDPRAADKDYVVSEPGVRFYAGVPITTKAGYQIGVFAVSDDKPRDDLKASEVKFMEDISEAIMEHLELSKERDDRNNGERMVRGLTEFIERSSTQDDRSTSSTRQTTLEKQTENARLEAIADEASSGATPAIVKEARLPKQRGNEHAHDLSRIYYRAAQIMRQSARADGVVFFDTSNAQTNVPVFESTASTGSSDGYSSTTAGSASALRRGRRGKAHMLPKKQADAEAAEYPENNMIPDGRPCPLVGLSLRPGALGVSENDFSFTEANIESYINRYPQGKFFNFDEDGLGIHSSDEKSEKSEPEQSDKTTASTNTLQRPRKRRPRLVPTELLDILPNVRSLIFLPIWDPASERWAASAFIWTMASGRLMNPDTEFPFLKAFSHSIISEIARWNAQKSDRTKTTFIASISHELRSPLHGILGSVEFLRDSISSSYQESLVNSIETCGRTLLDTIDHVLDYAKINKLRSVSARKKQRNGKRSNRLPADNSILGVTTVFNLSQLVEEVCDTVCAGHAFRRTHDIHNVTFHDQGTSSRANSNSSANTGESGYSGVRTKDRVVVTLSIAPFVQWIVKSQPGALRRVVMNLLGNALKYTEAGFITVYLKQDHKQSSKQYVAFSVEVEDSGKGMSTEYQRTRLFAPFSQEDPFSNGTGLGLSIVKQIVESLRGEISVESSLNVGTKITISLKLPTGAPEDARTTQTLLESPKELENKTASIMFPEISLGGAGEKLRGSMYMACQGFYMNPSVEFDGNSQPDFLLTEPDTLLKILGKQKVEGTHRGPLSVICICTDPAEKTAIEVSKTRVSIMLSVVRTFIQANFTNVVTVSSE